MRTAFLVVFCYAAAVETAFTLIYGLAFPWRRTELGRQMLLYAATVAAIMDLTLLRVWWRPPAWLYLGVYIVFAAALTWRLVILLRMWWQQHRPAHRA